ncbi:hypothetical protein GNI_060680 [Gregarina niphandrodes]|uniref:Uncharacterized protein n=1 Tax=Gregarina niphandrodes TaxID=110365 RepID=A0A023B8C7_GRENI|nr:hypothetical protein GNI_060680 [Gregarina niphandrodes]EZG68930.1 hypothetical protein GNI_060680 [Gregarina niphandrodes]|eukprot:XP_011134521.1 hypothetical protein GNI_060680 [Gregarina niphandrodes]
MEALIAHSARKFLCLRDYRNLCVSLRLFPEDVDRYVSLTRLHSQAQVCVTEPAEEEEWSQVPSGAFLLNRTHLVLPLPWRQVNDLDPALSIVEDLFCDPEDCGGNGGVLNLQGALLNPPGGGLSPGALSPRVPLESITIILKQVTYRALKVLRRLLESNASSVRVITITFGEVTAHEPLSFNRPVRSKEPQSENLATANRRPHMDSLIYQGDDPRIVAYVGTQYVEAQHDRADERSGCLDTKADCSDLCLNMEGLVFPQLTSMQLGVPFSCRNIEVPGLSSLRVYYLPEEKVGRWCSEMDLYRSQSVCEHQVGSLQHLLSICATSIEDLQLSGCVRLRQEANIFDNRSFFPHLKSLDLGWTCPAELHSLAEALKAKTSAPVAELLSIPFQTHAALMMSAKISDIEINTTNAVVTIPPRLPSLSSLFFNGPVRSGLSNLHLEIHQKVISRNENASGICLQYACYSASLENLLNFRLSFPDCCIFAIYRNATTRLHHLILRKSFTAIVRESTDFPSSYRYGRFRWDQFLRYCHVSSSTYNRIRLSRVMRSRRRLGEEDELQWEAQETLNSGEVVTPPAVDPSMNGRDLFALEMWQLPALSAGQCSDTECAYAVWNQLTSDQKSLYHRIAKLYVQQRQDHYSFETYRPWWKQKPLWKTRLQPEASIIRPSKCGRETRDANTQRGTTQGGTIQGGTIQGGATQLGPS